ncbi:hypothetical protein TrST_g988 [Triparma strigata]|uniref:Uncharacterized protein n=3 Tax=Triparma TaxID=722752 RepID=A0A9W7BWZ1_9STRA|nr:hypothetical protein TrST_g988 [Triparma strigata]
MPKSVQKQTAWDYSSMVTLDLTWYKMLQGVFFVITAMSSLYLLSVFGTYSSTRKAEYLTTLIGWVGISSSVVVLLINNIVIKRVHAAHKLQPSSINDNKRSTRSFSATEVEDGMVMASFV